MSLKNRFAGYKVEVVVKSEHVPDMIDIIKKKLPGNYKICGGARVVGLVLLLLFAVVV